MISPVSLFSALAQATQLVVVLAENWDASAGDLQCHTRSTAGSPWQAFGAAVPVVLGRAGLAWGRGLHDPVPSAPRHKREGDGCAPAGVFRITALFGEAGPDSDFVQSVRLPYRCASADLRCVDDPGSAHYNQIVDRRDLAVDWASAEEMRRPDQRYAIGAVIAHNPDRQPGAGSCIFLHVHEAPGVPTAGCTAGALADIRRICGWLDAAAQPLIVQLPRAEYARHAEAWGLPSGRLS